MDLFVQAIAALVAISNPIGAVPVFASLTSGWSASRRWRAALGVSIAVLVILAVTAFAGTWIFRAFGVTLAAFQAGGGLVVLLMGLDMLRGSATRMQHANEHEAEGGGEGGGSVIVPLAIPMIAGPGTITTVVTLTSHGTGVATTLEVVAASGVLAALVLVVLLGSAWLDRRMSAGAHAVLIRLMGLVLVAIGAQLILTGVKAFGVSG